MSLPRKAKEGLNAAMIDESILQEAVKRIVAAARPSGGILFGSYACNRTDRNSGPDIMLVKPQVIDKGPEMVRLHAVVEYVQIGADVLVYLDEGFGGSSRAPGTVL